MIRPSTKFEFRLLLIELQKELSCEDYKYLELNYLEPLKHEVQERLKELSAGKA